MSKTTKRKHVTREVTEEFILPHDELQVAKILASSGNNLHQVETAGGESFLASMPTKFRKNVWIKRGDYVLIQPIEEGDKVRAEIAHILYKPQIRYIQTNGKWPEAFTDVTVSDQSASNSQTTALIPDSMLPPLNDDDSGSSSDNDADRNRETTVCNPNRVVTSLADHVTSESEEESEEDVNDKSINR